MDYKYIEQLLDRYFEGETTLQEEQILKTFYAQESDDMPENLGRYAALFSELNQCPTLDGDFEERMLRMTEGQQEENAGNEKRVADRHPEKTPRIQMILLSPVLTGKNRNREGQTEIKHGQ